ncbi:MAG: metal-dependent hydrolase [Bryobacterales bacterium]|nr:metal-dependent hydrolase [Bryobacterales bacterium]
MLQITWLGHGSFHLQGPGGETLLIDPWFDNPKFPKDFTIDHVGAILITHGHFDHIASVRALAAKFHPQVVAIYEIATWLESKGVKNTIGMNKGGTAQVGSFAVTMTHALHSSSISDDDGRTVYAGEAAGYVLGLPDGRRAYFAGDTAVFGDMKLIADLYQPELAFLPIGDLYTMGPKEAALACRLVRAKKVIPMHWGTFPPLIGRPDQLADLISDLPETSVWPLEPGISVSW